MSKLFQEELSKQDKFGLICFLCVIVFLFPYILLQNIIEHVWIDKQANIKVQDPKNLKQGCLYFVGYKNTKYSKNLNHYYIHQDKLFFLVMLIIQRGILLTLFLLMKNIANFIMMLILIKGQNVIK